MCEAVYAGLLQRGMFNASLCQAGATPQDRGLAYLRYIQGCWSTHDQPLTGRGDSEAYQVGFVDVADTPYPELTEAARQVGENLYTYRQAGKLTNEMAPGKALSKR